MVEQLKITYHGVEIVYDERSNRFKFEQNGRERSSESLAKAKESIDKPEPKEKAPFKRQKVYLFEYGDGWREWEITSLAERADWEKQYAWIVRGKDRKKEPIRSIFPITDANTQAISLMGEYQDQIDKLNESLIKIRESMKCLTIDETKP